TQYSPVGAENSGDFIWAGEHWISSAPDPVIAVEAIGTDAPNTPDPSLARASFSNMGGDISAPGVGIVNTDVGGGYTIMQGTSMAAPQVTAAISYLLAYDPSLTIEGVKDALLDWTNSDTSGGASSRLDLFASLMSLPGAAKDLVDVNDRTVDGAKNESIQPDHVINMKDFR